MKSITMKISCKQITASKAYANGLMMNNKDKINILTILMGKKNLPNSIFKVVK